MKYLQIVTHNIFEFATPGDFRRQTLETMIRHAKAIVESKGGRVLPATMASVAVAYRKACPLERVGKLKLELDTRGRS